jgi:methanethiol S-methyltransferase
MEEPSTATHKSTALMAGVLCHGLFAAGVGMMIAQMHGGMSGAFGRLGAPWSFLANAALLLQFPALHSGLLTRHGQAILRLLAPPDTGYTLLPTIYVTIAGAQALLLFSLWTPSGIVWWQAEGVARLALNVLYAASWLILGKAIYDAGIALQTGLIGWRALFTGKRPAYPPMPVGGLFRLCRQPIYLGFTLTLWTVPVWTPDQLVIALVLSAYCLAGPLHKEARFQRMFGQAFTAYRAERPYFLPWPRRGR